LVRLFRGLRAEPNKSYDAAVIGAGVGGLICANLLARAGLSVLLIEQHFMVGGYCSTFRRKGYTFDAATHFYPLLGNPSTITGALLQELGITTEWIKMDPVDCFHLPDGTRFPVPADLESYLDRLKGEFREEAENIDRFFALVHKTYFIGLMHYFRNTSTDRLAPYQDLTILDVLNRHFRSEKLKLLLAGDVGHWGSLPSCTSFVFDSMLRFSYFLGNYYPRGGSQVFVDELAQRFEEAGGHILMSSMVRRILVRNHTTWGVEVETGTPRHRTSLQIAAGAVVSNADMLLTLERLIGPDLLDPGYLAGVRRLRPTLPCFLIHFGLKDISLEELGKIAGHHWSSWNIDDVVTDSFKVFLPTAYDPCLAPAGGQIAIIQKLTDIDYAAVADWAAHKQVVEDGIVRYLERRLPGFTSHISVQLSASAQTSHRYTLNYQGAMLGWQMSPDQLGNARPGPSAHLKNLYFVGHWTQPGGGITPVMVSAMQASRLITGNANDRTALPVGEMEAHKKVGASPV
jgi:phytoene dehydrogenase-like protein